MEPEARGTLLDPAAAEFHPAASSRFAVVAHPLQFYFPYRHPPPQPPPAVAVTLVAPPEAASRAVVLNMVPPHVGEAEVRAAMEPFGGVQAVDTVALTAQGIVTVHFYDLRSAQAAVMAFREHPATRQHFPATIMGNLACPWGWLSDGVGGRGLTGWPAVSAQFAASGLDEPNQGSILVLNSDPTVSCAALRQIFEAFGAVKEVRVMTSKQHRLLVEFYDKRDAARALSELHGKEVHGRRLVLEFGATGSQTRSFPLPPRLLRGNPKASRWIRSGPKPLSSSSPGKEFREVGNPSALLKSSSACDTHDSASIVERRNRRVSYCSKNEYPSPPPSSNVHHHRTNISWKTNQKKEGDSKFLFKEVQPEESRPSSRSDSRTTVMIRNIPNKYSRKLLLNMLDNHCKHCNEQIGEEDDDPISAYDFVYLPIDFNNKCNVGYGFVNLTSPEAAFRLYKAFHQQPWEVFNSRKICQITYARLQGLEALMEHFRHSRFACHDDEYMPVVFSPPRDGRQFTDPVPVAGGCEATARGNNLADGASVAPAEVDRCAASSTAASTNAPPDQGGGGDSDEA
ncbi:hypothetical protein C4D60_Mb08t01200 [Musa balbisiana]|uniref:RRM domain-containing protein n=1 Tax=Musa balbisiana TaxID=52838 RepID=A0A4S8K0G2_MUSBA|nr:hypothetical protein C4D60_Mb08t01200 [Musa balbisiana]